MILFGFAFAIRSQLAFDLFKCVEAARIPETRFLPGFNNHAGAWWAADIGLRFRRISICAFAIRSKLALDLFECIEAARIPETRFFPGFNNIAGA
jgi:hypothetical protein